MTDGYLKNFIPGEKVKAYDTNSNNQYLLNEIDERAGAMQTYIENQVSQLNSTVNTTMQTLTAQMNNMKTELQNEVRGKTFTTKVQSIGIGTTSLTNYLPKDGLNYWVMVNGQKAGQGDNKLSISSDLLTSARTAYLTDWDSGRYSRAAFLGLIPIGRGRKIITSGVADNVYLCGYAKM